MVAVTSVTGSSVLNFDILIYVAKHTENTKSPPEGEDFVSRLMPHFSRWGDCVQGSEENNYRLVFLVFASCFNLN